MRSLFVTLRRRFGLDRDELLSYWRRYYQIACKFHTPSESEFNVLFVRYMLSEWEFEFERLVYACLWANEGKNLTITSLI